jgi:hypothetical protein
VKPLLPPLYLPPCNLCVVWFIGGVKGFGGVIVALGCLWYLALGIKIKVVDHANNI